MEASIAGFKVTGAWSDIVEHGDRITYALRDVGVDRPEEVGEDLADAFHEWDEWRPKADESIRRDVAKKTADQASVGEGEGEKAGKGADEDIKTAGEKLSESYEHLDEPAAAVDKWGESIDYVARAADTAGRKALRRVEDAVYRRVMTTVSPYYFDNELISANLDRKRGGDEPQYVFEVNINDDEIKAAVEDRLETYERDFERWHVDTPTRTDIVEAAEGVDLSEEHGSERDA